MANQAQSGNEGMASSKSLQGILKKVFTFEEFYTPKAITLVFWLLCLASVVQGVSIMNIRYLDGAGVWGLLAIVGGLVMSRIVCEIIIVVFKINENLKSMANR